MTPGRRYRTLITGASGGLGRAIAHALAPRSSAMILAGRDAASLSVLRRALATEHPHLEIDARTGDLTDGAARQRLVDAAGALAKPVDLLVNNAGANDFHAFERQSAQAIERLIAVDLVAPMLLTRALLPLMKRADRACIVNVGSVLGYIGYPGFSAYCAAKAGLRGFSQALRRELADSNVEVRYFAPRATRTRLNSAAVSALNRALGSREDDPADVARALLGFLDARSHERVLGFPERLYVLLNQWAPWISDRAIRARLPVIRDHLPGAANRSFIDRD